VNRIDNVNFDGYAASAEGEHIITLSQATSAIRERFEHGVQTFGDPMPWSKTHDNFRFRPGEATIWAGTNGHGKSIVTSHICAHLMKHTTCLVASLEMPVAATGQRMLRQMIGSPKPTNAFIYRALSWTGDRLWVYDQLDTVPARRIIGLCIYSADVLKVQHIFIDSMMKCGIRSDDLDGQEKFVDRLTWIAKHYDIHIHLVHHVRKGIDETARPTKYDLKGSGAIADLADNVIIVHRNKGKERKIAQGDDVKDNVPDTTLDVEKQRHGEWEGRINLWFHKQSQQFLPSSSAKHEYFDLVLPHEQ